MRNFNKIIEKMQLHKMKVPNTKVQISIPNAKKALSETMKYILKYDGKEMIWIEPYNEVAEWLSDNKGLGLFMYGNCGLGKSVLARYVLPAIILQELNKVVTVYDMNYLNANIDEALAKRIICLDDVGTEEMSVKYGERRLAFAEIMDMAEKNNNLVIVTTNLNMDDLRNRYGDRVLDRIKSTTKRVLFTGKSFRG